MIYTLCSIYVCMCVTKLAGDSTGDHVLLPTPPGTYYLVLKHGFSTTSSARANVTVNIGKCPKGHVTGGRDDTCNKCPLGLFSFNPRDPQCSVCGANAVCPGGAVVWPAEGFWNSAPQSVEMHR
jgi:hypothetical protein